MHTCIHTQAERPELNYGSVEYVAPADYMVRPPQPPAFVFVIDVSARAVQSGLLKEVCDTLLASLDKLPGGQRTQVCVCVCVCIYICMYRSIYICM